MNIYQSRASMWILFFVLYFTLPIYGQNKTSVKDYDHLSMQLSFQPDSTLQVTARYRISRPRSNEVYFILNPGYQIDAIQSEGLVKYEKAMKEDRPLPYYRLHFDKDLQDQGPIDISFEYTIDLVQSNQIMSNWLEFNVDQLWIPKYDDLDSEFTWDITIENIYKGYSLVCYRQDHVSRYRTIMEPSSRIRLQQAEPDREVWIMMARDMILWENKNRTAGADIRFFVHEDTPEPLLVSMDKKLSDLIPFFNASFGAAMPVERYLMVLRNTDDIKFLQSRGEILLGNRNSDSYAALAHEVAHFWWAFADFIKEPWMNESFANYSMFLALDQFDQMGLEKQLARSRKRAPDTASVRSAGIFTSNMNTYYHKGSVLLWELEKEIGREALLKLLSKRVLGKVNSTQGFLQLLEEQEGPKAREKFESRL